MRVADVPFNQTLLRRDEQARVSVLIISSREVIPYLVDVIG